MDRIGMIKMMMMMLVLHLYAFIFLQPSLLALHLTPLLLGGEGGYSGGQTAAVGGSFVLPETGLAAELLMILLALVSALHKPLTDYCR